MTAVLPGAMPDSALTGTNGINAATSDQTTHTAMRGRWRNRCNRTILPSLTSGPAHRTLSTGGGKQSPALLEWGTITPAGPSPARRERSAVGGSDASNGGTPGPG